MIQLPAAKMMLCPLGISRTWFRAAPALQDGSAWRFILCVCVCFFFSQAGGRIPFILYIVAVCRRPTRPQCLERETSGPGVPCYQPFPRLASLGKALWMSSKISITCIIVFYPPRVPSTQWKQQQQPQSRALPPNTRLPLVTRKVAFAYTKLTASWLPSVAQASAPLACYLQCVFKK